MIIRPGAWITVHHHDGTTLRGNYVGMEKKEITVQLSGTELSLPLESVAWICSDDLSFCWDDRGIPEPLQLCPAPLAFE